MLLDCNVGQVDEHVVHLMRTAVVLGRAESAETTSKKIGPQRPERRHQDVEAQIEFFATDQQRTLDVLGDDVGFARWWRDRLRDGCLAHRRITLVRPFLDPR